MDDQNLFTQKYDLGPILDEKEILGYMKQQLLYFTPTYENYLPVSLFFKVLIGNQR